MLVTVKISLTCGWVITVRSSAPLAVVHRSAMSSALMPLRLMHVVAAMSATTTAWSQLTDASASHSC